MSDVLLMNGPNLNLLGQREPEIYGQTSLEEIEVMLQEMAQGAGLQLETFQSNHEGQLIDRLHSAAQTGTRLVICNPGAYTHTSIALRDAFLAVEIPLIEVHISNPHERESFRHHSYFSDIASGVISGFGVMSYQLAMAAAISFLDDSAQTSE
ncbi:MAG: type II 3-dehydroquinate dehydratase [Legionellales bacterium]|nr:type II 3-dehydroquinate dehydratase [Legionellales bacterium]